MYFDITKFGAIPQEDTINTKAIQAAINACHEHGGGIVYCPPGIYYTGSIWLKSNITLYLENGCELKACPDPSEYNSTDCFPEHEVVAYQNTDGTHLLLAYKQENITIKGGGCIHGNNECFFKCGKFEHPQLPGEYMYNLPDSRPGQMLYFCKCKNIKIYDISMNYACFWTVYMLGCEQIQVRNVTINTARLVPNADGLHFNCCKNVIISDCNISSQDDCLVFRGHYRSLLSQNMACENVTVTNCILQTRCCAIRIGVGDGIIRNCLFSNLVIFNTKYGINIMPAYSERYPRGTDLDNISFNNITMDVMIPIYMSNGGSANLRNINFSDLKVNMTHTVIINGEPDNNYNDVTISNSIFNIVPGRKQKLGGMYLVDPNCYFYVANTTGFKLRDSVIRSSADAAKVDSLFKFTNCDNPSLVNVDLGNCPDLGIAVFAKDMPRKETCSQKDNLLCY